MIKEDKQLLLKDLCARLPYGVNVKTTGDNESYTLLSINSNKNIALIGLNFDGVYATSKIKIDELKPYIRPMSSMTEEEKEELKCLFDAENITDDSICFLEGGTLEEYEAQIPFSFCSKLIDWLNAHHFDYRDLIPKGLAIEAPEGMYKEKQQ